MHQQRVEKFVKEVQQKLNQNLFWTVLIWAATIGILLTVAVGLTYILRGFPVPKVLYLLAAGCSLLAAGGTWLIKRISSAQASNFADVHFGLKDGVTSCRNFATESKQGGYFDLQAEQTDENLKALSPKSIPFPLPRRTLAVGLVFGVAATLMAFVGPSQTVQHRLDLEIATVNQTKQLNEQLKDLVEELEEELQDEEEKELVEPNKLREWVDKLEETKDQKEALRQYAKLEQKIQKASKRLEQKRDEQFLERAAKELDKGAETKKLAENLKQKKYDDAAKELEKMKADPSKKLSEQRKDLAKLKAAAKRMLAAKQQASKNKGKSSATPQKANASAKSLAKDATKNSAARNANPSNNAQSDSGEGGDSQQSGDESVEELVQEWEQAIEKLENQLANAQMQQTEKGDISPQQLGQCQECQGGAQKALSKLSRKLSKMGMKKKIQSKLASLCQACSQCQSQCAGLCQSPSPNPGGQEAGTGSSDSSRNERDELVDNGQTTQLKGQKGLGPSITSVEAADDGSGVSNARHVAASRSFERQMESFVEREDVPDDVKSGVRTYFEMIHQSE